MKYKMKDLGFMDNSSDRIVELEPLDCPASECDGGECECDHLSKPMTYWGGKDKPKETKESLEDVIEGYLTSELGMTDCVGEAEELAQIAKEHYQDNPEELED